MILEARAKSSPENHIGPLPIKSENTESVTYANPNLSKQQRQQYLIDEIKKLVGDCEDFIGLVPGPGGVPEVVVSPNLRSDKWKIIGEAHGTFSEYLSMHRPCTQANFCGLPNQYVKASKQDPPADNQTPSGPSGSISITIQRPLKRHRSKTNATASRSASNPKSRHGGASMRVVESSVSQIRVDDHKQLAEWYKNAFLRLQQVACRLVAKIWIKKIHPKKQSTHPYNGQMPRNATRDPDRTRPPYWPTDVKHREPDHIGRDERTRLLVHLIMKTPQPVVTNPSADPSSQQYVYARDLLECLEPKRGERELTEERWEMIQQIITAREMQERYDAREIDGDTLIFLCDYKEDDGSRLRAITSDDDEPDNDDTRPKISSEGSDAAGDGCEPTPGSSSQTSPMDRTHPEIPLSISCTRGSADNLVFPKRRIATCRPRPSFNGGQSTAALAIRAGPSFAPEMTMGLKSVVTHVDAGMLPLVAMHQQVPRSMFGRMESLNGTTEMIHGAGHGANPGANVHVPSWAAIMPNMGPDPPPEMFGVPPAMTPTSMKYPYFDQELDMASEIPNGMHHALLSPAQYQEFVDSTHRTLPHRGAQSQHPVMIPTHDVNMEMMASHFY